jgi:hypothetical protein
MDIDDGHPPQAKQPLDDPHELQIRAKRRAYLDQQLCLGLSAKFRIKTALSTSTSPNLPACAPQQALTCGFAIDTSPNDTISSSDDGAQSARRMESSIEPQQTPSVAALIARFRTAPPRPPAQRRAPQQTNASDNKGDEALVTTPESSEELQATQAVATSANFTQQSNTPNFPASLQRDLLSKSNLEPQSPLSPKERSCSSSDDSDDGNNEREQQFETFSHEDDNSMTILPDESLIMRRGIRVSARCSMTTSDTSPPDKKPLRDKGASVVTDINLVAPMEKESQLESVEALLKHGEDATAKGTFHKLANESKPTLFSGPKSPEKPVLDTDTVARTTPLSEECGLESAERNGYIALPMPDVNSIDATGASGSRRERPRVLAFWDIENVHIPRGVSSFGVVAALRGRVSALLEDELKAGSLPSPVWEENFQPRDANKDFLFNFHVSFRVAVFHSPSKATLSNAMRRELSTAGVSLIDVGKVSSRQYLCDNHQCHMLSISKAFRHTNSD